MYNSMHDLESAKQLLTDGGFTCVLCFGEHTITSQRRGVAPLLDLLSNGTDVTNYSAADKVVGKATAMLYRLLGVRQVYGAIISDAAIQTLKAGNIEVSFGKQVAYIINRTGDGRCPMETATAAIDAPIEALAAIKAKLKELQG